MPRVIHTQEGFVNVKKEASRRWDVKEGGEDGITSYVNENEFLFYSNNPESIEPVHLTENKKWLCRETVKGNGQIYTWHRNECHEQIYSAIVVYNPNKIARVKVSITNMGLTNQTDWPSDLTAWKDYLSIAQNIEKVIEADGYLSLFNRAVEADSNFGIISRISFTYEDGTPAEVTIFDIAYINSINSGNAIEPADAYIDSKAPKSSPHRGKGKGFYETFDLSLIANEDIGNKVKMVSMGKDDDSFNGKDMIKIVDSSGQIKFDALAGHYGIQMNINLSVLNKGVAGNFKVVMGSIGGSCIPFVSYNGEFGNPSNGKQIEASMLIDVLDLGYVGQNETVKVNFFTSLVALSSAPFIIGIYKL